MSALLALLGEDSEQTVLSVADAIKDMEIDVTDPEIVLDERLSWSRCCGRAEAGSQLSPLWPQAARLLYGFHATIRGNGSLNLQPATLASGEKLVAYDKRAAVPSVISVSILREKMNSDQEFRSSFG